MANRAQIKNQIVHVGDTVKVFQKIREKEKERLQVFKGIIIKIKGSQENKTFTVRRIASAGIGVERIWPVESPWITKIEIIKRGKVRRAKLYYLRKRVGKKAVRVKTKKAEKPATDKKNKKAEDEKKKQGKPRGKHRPKTPAK